MAIDVEALTQPFQDKIDGLPNFARIATIRHRQNEFIAAEPAKSHIARRELGHAVSNFLQQTVAGRMAERIVDVLESVEIEHRD